MKYELEVDRISFDEDVMFLTKFLDFIIAKQAFFYLLLHKFSSEYDYWRRHE